MIQFERLTLDKKPEYDALLRHAAHRGCAFSFANLYLWGRQCTARVGENLLIFSHYGGKTVYPFPVGPDVNRETIELLMEGQIHILLEVGWQEFDLSSHTMRSPHESGYST